VVPAVAVVTMPQAQVASVVLEAPSLIPMFLMALFSLFTQVPRELMVSRVLEMVVVPAEPLSLQVLLLFFTQVAVVVTLVQTDPLVVVPVVVPRR
jgi:hypothetical protein